MANPILSNEVANKAVVLWQYDQAPNLLALLRGFNDIAKAVVTDFWDYFRDCVFNVGTADSFGLNVLGRLLGLPRPTVVLSQGGDPQPVGDDFYRRLLLGRFFLFNMAPTTPNYNRYLRIIYGGSAAAVTDGLDMSITFNAPSAPLSADESAGDEDGADWLSGLPDPALAEAQAMHAQHPDLVYFYPAGIKTTDRGHQCGDVIGLEGQTLQPFASVFAWAGDATVNGGVVAGNSEARYLPLENEGEGH